MNTGLGTLERISEKRAIEIRKAFTPDEDGAGIFEIDEVLKIKGCLFRIKKISRKQLKLEVIQPDS